MSHIVSFISCVDPLLRDLSCLISLGLADPTKIIVTDFQQGEIAISVMDSKNPQPKPTLILLSQSCYTCSLRETLLTFLSSHAESFPGSDTIVFLPPGIELSHLIPMLASDIRTDPKQPDLKIATVAHLIDIDSAKADILERHLLSTRKIILGNDADRCIGEVHANCLAYADLIVTSGSDPIGSDLVKHIVSPKIARVDGLAELRHEDLFSKLHNVDEALARINPAAIQTRNGPQENGVWTLELYSELPFHPIRFKQLAQNLAGENLYTRGCFWLPSRPSTVCSWDAAGGSVTIGDAGKWETPAHCHFVVTGIGNYELQDNLQHIFKSILLSEEEIPKSLMWLGADDGLAEWFE